MLPSLNQPTSRATRRTLLVLGFVAIAAVALPTIQWKNPTQSGGLAIVFADDKAPSKDAAKGPVGTDGREKAGAGKRAPEAVPEIEYLPRPSKFEEQVLAALEKPIDFEFLDLPLEDCLSFINETAQLPIWLDKQTLTDEGVALDQPVTLKLKGGRLESVLNLILNPSQLTFLPKNDVLVITTATKAGENLITRTYPVRDLFQGRAPEADAERSAPKAAPQKNGPVQDEGSDAKAAIAPVNIRNNKGGGFFDVDDQLAQNGGGGGGRVGGQPAGVNAGAQPAANASASPRRHTDLIDAIINTIEPDSWENLSGPGTYTYVKETGCLVILQTWAVHRQIVQLLRDLREAKKLTTGAGR